MASLVGSRRHGVDSASRSRLRYGPTIEDPVMSTVVRLPFEPLAPNDETVAAMKAARRGELVDVGDLDALMADLDADD